jgi:hypothetical protein
LDKMIKFLDDSPQNNSFLEYVISQGLKGHHVLFDNEQIRRAFAKGDMELTSLGVDRVREVRGALREIFELGNTEERRDYIAGLPEEIQHILVFLYFQILEKNILAQKNKLH